MSRFTLLLIALVPLVVFAVPASGQNKVPADEQVLNIGHRGLPGWRRSTRSQPTIWRSSRVPTT